MTPNKQEMLNKPNTKRVWTRGFKLTFTDSKSTPCILEIPYSVQAEQILRGLVHSGFEVTITEDWILVEEPERHFGGEPVPIPCDPQGNVRG